MIEKLKADPEARAALVQQRADRVHHLDVLLLGIAANVVGLAGPAFGERHADRLTVVGDIQPVAHLPAVAVDRDGLALQRQGMRGALMPCT